MHIIRKRYYYSQTITINWFALHSKAAIICFLQYKYETRRSQTRDKTVLIASVLQMTISALTMQSDAVINSSKKIHISSRMESLVRCLDEVLLKSEDILQLGDDCGVDHQMTTNETTAIIENMHSISYLPPLDQITICSDGNCSDTSSIGDVSLTDSAENDARSQCYDSEKKNPFPSMTQPKVTLRTIFDRYWEKNPIIHHIPESKALPESCINYNETMSVNSYDRMTRSNRSCDALEGSTSPSRRRIFHGVSLPEVATSVQDHQSLVHHNSRPLCRFLQSTHKVHSDSSLLLRKKPSCLRRSRFSVSSTATSSSVSPTTPTCDDRRTSVSSCTGGDGTSSVVTFSPKVDVVVFRKPVEQFAAKGWSEYFLS